MTRASGGFGATNGPITATSTTNEASPSPMAPRGVRAAEASTDHHWCRRIRGTCCGRAAGAAGAFTAMGYLAILRRGVASRAITSVRMFMKT